MNHQSMNIRIQAPCPPSPSSPRFHHKSPLILPRVNCSNEVASNVVLHIEASSDVGNLSTSISKRKRNSGWSQKQSLVLKRSLNKDLMPLRALMTSSTQDTPASFVNDGKIGVLLLNLGGPETLDDVQPFLFNLFADPDIIRLPRLFRFLQKPLAQFISVARAPKSKEGYASIGGGSPLRQITDAQATELRKALYEKNVPAEVYVGMRYWHPFTEEAIEHIKKDGVNKLVVLPLYPQFSISTSGSSLRLLESIFREDEYLVNMQHTVIPSWYQREGYIKAMAGLIEKELKGFNQPEKVMIFFSAHGVPLAYVEEAGDPYKAEMEECVDLIMEELERRKINNPYTLAYQSRVGPVEWLKPYTDQTIIELGQKGVKSLLAVPISFVSEHIETLEEIDVEYKELALESGIVEWGRVPALGCEPTFIKDLADAVIESLPYVGAMAVSNLEARQPCFLFIISSIFFIMKSVPIAKSLTPNPTPPPNISQITTNHKTNINSSKNNHQTIKKPSMSDILSSSKAQNLDLDLQTLGPFFRITAKSLETNKVVGKAEGMIRVWWNKGKILHLDSIKLTRETLGMERSVFGIGLFIGAVMIRYGYDCGCKTAELLAINDSDVYHAKLVKFYRRIGFETVHEVTGSSMADLAHMLVWGGVGTRMDADVEQLLLKWCTRFTANKANSKFLYGLIREGEDGQNDVQLLTSITLYTFRGTRPIIVSTYNERVLKSQKYQFFNSSFNCKVHV